LGLPKGAIDNGDGTYTVGSTTFSMENDTPLYTTDANGKITISKADSGGGGDETTRLSQEAGLSPGESIMYDNGTTVTALDDGNGGVKYVYGGTDKETGFGPKGATSPTRGLGGENADSSEGDDTVVSGGDAEYFQDDYGNIYTMNENGSYELFSDAGGSTGAGSDYVADNTWTDPDTGDVWNMAEDGSWSMEGGGDTYADNTYYDDQTGATWTMADNGEWSTDFNWDDYYANEYYGDDYALADNTDYNDDYFDYSDYEYAKRGGLITMMKKGGIAHMADGGYMPYGAEDNGDGTYTIDNQVFDMMTDEPLYTMNDSGGIMYVEPSTGSAYQDNGDGTYTIGGITYDMMSDMPLYGTDTRGNILLSQDNGDGTYTIGNETYDMMTNEPVYTTNTRTGEITVNPNAITGSGGGSRAWYDDLGSLLNKGLTSATGLGKTAYEGITNALGTTAGAAGAGALIATLLNQDSGSGDTLNAGLDMSKVGVINPRTTDFGIGPTNFVGYEDYGTSDGDYTPNAELLKNLNAPGYNPVNEGDYGYEEVAAEETEEAPKMASGGLSSMATPVASYYTFGQPADILANLGMRQQPPMNPPEMMPQIGQQQQPQQTQQQGLPQQAPPQMMQQAPQGMPQQGIMPQQQGMAPPMRKGGLPRASDVPIVEGRMDFRKGSAVHGPGDGQSDDIPAMLADGEYVIDAETVAQIGNGSTKAGAQALDKFRESIRAHKRSAPVNKIPPKTKALTSYLKG
jgi:hypothetical protein